MNFTQSEIEELKEGLYDLRKRNDRLYKRYYRSSWWKGIRQRKLEQDPVCELCNQRPSVQVHHSNYAFFNEHIDFDLEATCKRCHFALHRR